MYFSGSGEFKAFIYEAAIDRISDSGEYFSQDYINGIIDTVRSIIDFANKRNGD